MKKLLILFSTLFSLNLIGSSTANLNAKDFFYYTNLGIKTIAYPFVQWWNSKRSTKAFLTISTIGGLLFFKHIKMSNDQLKKEADILSTSENRLNQAAQTIKTYIEKISHAEKDEQQNLINKIENSIDGLQKYQNTLNSERTFDAFSTNNKIKLMTLRSKTQIEISKSLEKLNEIKKNLTIK